MNKTSLYIVPICLVCLLGGYACTGDKEVDELKSQLTGRWDLEEAFRNGRRTTSLENLFFEFYGEDSLRTNLNNGRVEAFVYNLEESQIIPEGSSLDAQYSIDEISDTSLVLSAKIGRFPFRFHLSPAPLDLEQ